MLIKATLSNARHPEYGEVTIPFPIKTSEYDHTMEMLANLEIGNVMGRDCKIMELSSPYSILQKLEGSEVNIDELDYLAKRLESFEADQDLQFQAAAFARGVTSIEDFINLTFCSDRVTVIYDFTNLEAVGRQHFMNLYGGCASMEELENLDGYETALLLIDGGGAEIMPMYFKNCFNPKKETLEIPRSSLHRANLLDAEELLLHTGGGYIMVTRNALDTRECLHLLRFLTSIAKSLLFQLVVNSNQDEEFDDDEWDEDYGDMPDGDTPNADCQEDSEISIPDWMLKQAGLSTEHGLEISVENGKVTISAANQVQKSKEAPCGGCADPLACFDDGFLSFLLMAGVDLEQLEQQMRQEAADHA